jgi:hypothetical protein
MKRHNNTLAETLSTTPRQSKKQKVSFGDVTTHVSHPLSRSSGDGNNTGMHMPTHPTTIEECENELANLRKQEASQNPDSPAKIRELQSQIEKLRQKINKRVDKHTQITARTQADLVNMVLGDPIPRTSITAEKRKSWNHELESWTVKLTKSHDESAATLAAVISYSTVAEIVNPPAETAFKKFRLAMSSKADPRLSKLKNALESTAQELANDLHTASWKTIWSSAVRKAMPADSDHAIKSQLEREEYKNASQYTQQIRKYLKILELLNISTPTNHDIHRTYEKAIGNAIKAGAIEMDLLKGFEDRNLSGQPIGVLQNELDTIEARLSRTNRLSKQTIPPRGQNKRTNSPIPNCGFCNKPGHSESTCKTKKYGEVCKGCKRRVHTKDRPNHKCEPRKKPTTSTTRAQEDLVIVPGLPEQMIWGLELLNNIGCNIMLDPKPAKCTSTKGGFSETFTSEEEYVKQQKARSLAAAEEIADKVQEEKLTRIITSQERPGQTYSDDEVPTYTDTKIFG